MTDDQLFDIPATVQKMAPAKFIGGPLDGQRRKVPEHGPAFVRYWGVDGECFWYVIRKGTRRTYRYAGV